MQPFRIKRKASFAILAAVYLAAIGVGVGVYLLCPFHFAVNLLIADTAATVFVFLFSLIFRNASVYDPYWSVQPPVIATAFAIVHGFSLWGFALLSLVWIWGARLTSNWAYTFHGLGHQDWRYTMLREKTGKLYPVINFLGIHMVPTLVVYGCTLPVVYAIVYGWKGNALSVIFGILSPVASTLQGVADLQMQHYRRTRPTPFIRVGLWKYSRHPNYLCEILQWWSIGLAVVSASGAWPLLGGALANTLLFLFVSIPLADGRQSRKEGWETYKKETRMLLPIYKKK